LPGINIIFHKRHGKQANKLYIYSGTLLPEKEKRLLNKKGTYFMGNITKDKISNIQKGSDILILAEALKGKYKYGARLSFSTQIVDYFPIGKCILALDAEGLVAIEYMGAYGAAMTESDEQSTKEILVGHYPIQKFSKCIEKNA